MKLKILIFVILFIGCKNINYYSDNQPTVKLYKNDRFEFLYPQKWVLTKIKSQTFENSAVVLRNKHILSHEVFIVHLDVYNSTLELKELTQDLINIDEKLKKSNIDLIKQESSFIEFSFKHEKNNIIYREFKRFYKINNQISEISFQSKDKDFIKFENYKNLFFDSFKMKETD